MKIRIKQLERRVSILEAQAHVSAEAEAAARIRELCDFWTSSEINEYVHFLEQDADHHKLNEMVLRSTTRREQYPDLWFGIHQRRGGDLAIPEPWSAEAEIEAIRNDVALMWEWRGLALNLDALTTHDLTILDHLQPKWSLGLAYWNCVKTIAKCYWLRAPSSAINLEKLFHGRTLGAPLTGLISSSIQMHSHGKNGVGCRTREKTEIRREPESHQMI